jgi:hypothetical protein
VTPALEGGGIDEIDLHEVEAPILGYGVEETLQPGLHLRVSAVQAVALLVPVEYGLDELAVGVTDEPLGVLAIEGGLDAHRERGEPDAGLEARLVNAVCEPLMPWGNVSMMLSQSPMPV